MFGIPRNWLLLFQKNQTRSRKGIARLTFVALLEIQISDIIVLDSSRFKKSGRPCKLDEKRVV